MGIDDCLCEFRINPASLQQPLKLGGSGCCNNEGRIVIQWESIFEKERHIRNEKPVVIGLQGLIAGGMAQSTHFRMKNPFQSGPARGVSKDVSSELRTINSASRVEELIPENLCDSRHDQGSCQQFMHTLVAIEKGGTGTETHQFPAG